jgi:2-polyprenyl-3-methyl-5-hydroxy-6-metoxy-1,4-benzoquinol methylase
LTKSRPPHTARPEYDRGRAERYWGTDRRRLRDDFRIVLSAGEPHAVNAAYHRWETESLCRAEKNMKGRRVLDLACGLGRVSHVLRQQGAAVIGADNAMAMLRVAKKKSKSWRGAVKGGSASWSQAVSDRLPFGDASFDFVVCFGLLEHLPRRLQLATLKEALRVLKPKGSLYLVLNNNHSLLLKSGQDNRYRRAVQLDNGYFCGLVDRRSLLSLLERQGARVDVLGSNAHYSLLRHGLRDRLQSPSDRNSAERAFQEATTRDLDESSQGWLGESCADHFLYRIRRASSRRRT